MDAPFKVVKAYTQSTLPDPISRLIVELCGLCFVVAANDGLFEDFQICARQTSDDDVQVILKLTDQYGFDYLLGFHPQDGLKLQRFENDGLAEQSEYIMIEQTIDEDDELEPNVVCEFMEESIGNFSSNLDFVYAFISSVLGNNQWEFEDSDGLKWFLWSKIEKKSIQ